MSTAAVTAAVVGYIWATLPGDPTIMEYTKGFETMQECVDQGEELTEVIRTTIPGAKAIYDCVYAGAVS